MSTESTDPKARKEQQNRIMLVGLVAIPLVALGAALAAAVIPEPVPPREPASIPSANTPHPDEDPNLHPKEDGHSGTYRKTMGPIDVELESSLGPRRAEVGSRFSLRARVETRIDVEKLNYEFQLPEGLRALSGETGGTLVSNQGDRHEFAIEVETTGPVSGRPRFRAWMSAPSGEPIGKSASLSLEGSPLRALQVSGGGTAHRSVEEFRRRAIH